MKLEKLFKKIQSLQTFNLDYIQGIHNLIPYDEVILAASID